ncbi:MAG: hypothetical protein IPM69_16045 [Ignavibacteria bacterium]|nr:hypothetical protein [Ignavibacteria bacterium]
MLKKFVKSIVGILPSTLQRSIRVVFSAYNDKVARKNWERNGRPAPPPDEVKHEIIAEYQRQSKSQLLVETGTYLGNTIWALKENFVKLYSIELSPELWKNAVKRFAQYSHITILHGDSGKVLFDVVPRLQERTVFWLDGHYSWGITAQGEKNCPIFEELEAIFKNNSLLHVMLIDDARLFNGTGDYPTLEELRKFVHHKNPQYHMDVKDDIIRLTAS